MSGSSALHLSLLAKGIGSVKKNGHERVDVVLEPEDYFNYSTDRFYLPPIRPRLAFPEDTTPKSQVHEVSLPKTFTTRRGALLLFSEDFALKAGEEDGDEGNTSYRQGKNAIPSQGVDAFNIHTIGDLTKSILTYGNPTSRDEINLRFIKNKNHHMPQRVRPGFSARRYLSRLTRSFDDSFLEKLMSKGYVNEKSLFAYNNLMPHMRMRLNDDMSYMPTPYRIMKQMLVSPGLLSGCTFLKGIQELSDVSELSTVVEEEEDTHRSSIQVVEMKDGVAHRVSYSGLSQEDKEHVLADLLVKSAINHALEKQKHKLIDSSKIASTPSVIQSKKSSAIHSITEFESPPLETDRATEEEDRLTYHSSEGISQQLTETGDTVSRVSEFDMGQAVRGYIDSQLENASLPSVFPHGAGSLPGSKVSPHSFGEEDAEPLSPNMSQSSGIRQHDWPESAGRKDFIEGIPLIRTKDGHQSNSAKSLGASSHASSHRSSQSSHAGTSSVHFPSHPPLSPIIDVSREPTFNPHSVVPPIGNVTEYTNDKGEQAMTLNIQIPQLTIHPPTPQHTAGGMVPPTVSREPTVESTLEEETEARSSVIVEEEDTRWPAAEPEVSPAPTRPAAVTKPKAGLLVASTESLSIGSSLPATVPPPQGPSSFRGKALRGSRPASSKSQKSQKSDKSQKKDEDSGKGTLVYGPDGKVIRVGGSIPMQQQETNVIDVLSEANIASDMEGEDHEPWAATDSGVSKVSGSVQGHAKHLPQGSLQGHGCFSMTSPRNDMCHIYEQVSNSSQAMWHCDTSSTASTSQKLETLQQEGGGGLDLSQKSQPAFLSKLKDANVPEKNKKPDRYSAGEVRSDMIMREFGREIQTKRHNEKFSIHKQADAKQKAEHGRSKNGFLHGKSCVKTKGIKEENRVREYTKRFADIGDKDFAIKGLATQIYGMPRNKAASLLPDKDTSNKTTCLDEWVVTRSTPDSCAAGNQRQELSMHCEGQFMDVSQQVDHLSVSNDDASQNSIINEFANVVQTHGQGSLPLVSDQSCVDEDHTALIGASKSIDILSEKDECQSMSRPTSILCHKTESVPQEYVLTGDDSVQRISSCSDVEEGSCNACDAGGQQLETCCVTNCEEQEDEPMLAPNCNDNHTGMSCTSEPVDNNLPMHQAQEEINHDVEETDFKSQTDHDLDIKHWQVTNMERQSQITEADISNSRLDEESNKDCNQSEPESLPNQIESPDIVVNHSASSHEIPESKSSTSSSSSPNCLEHSSPRLRSCISQENDINIDPHRYSPTDIPVDSEHTTHVGSQRSEASHVPSESELVQTLTEHAQKIAALVLSRPETGISLQEDAQMAAQLWLSRPPSQLGSQSESNPDMTADEMFNRSEQSVKDYKEKLRESLASASGASVPKDADISQELIESLLNDTLNPDDIEVTQDEDTGRSTIRVKSSRSGAYSSSMKSEGDSVSISMSKDEALSHRSSPTKSESHSRSRASSKAAAESATRDSNTSQTKKSPITVTSKEAEQEEERSRLLLEQLVQEAQLTPAGAASSGRQSKKSGKSSRSRSRSKSRSPSPAKNSTGKAKSEKSGKSVAASEKSKISEKSQAKSKSDISKGENENSKDKEEFVVGKVPDKKEMEKLYGQIDEPAKTKEKKPRVPAAKPTKAKKEISKTPDSKKSDNSKKSVKSKKSKKSLKSGESGTTVSPEKEKEVVETQPTPEQQPKESPAPSEHDSEVSIKEEEEEEMEFIIVRDEFDDEDDLLLPEMEVDKKSVISFKSSKSLKSMISEEPSEITSEGDDEDDPLKQISNKEARAAKRAAQAAKRREDVDRRRKEREEVLKRERMEAEEKDRMIREMEGNMQRMEEERRMKRVHEREEAERLEREQADGERRAALEQERERRMKEEFQRKLEEMKRQKEEEDKRRQERDEQLRREAEDRRRREASMLAAMAVEEREEYERRMKEEEEQRKLDEELRRKRQEEEARIAMEEAKRLAEEYAHKQAELQRRLMFNRGLATEGHGLDHTQNITKAFVYSYFELLQWLGLDVPELEKIKAIYSKRYEG